MREIWACLVVLVFLAGCGGRGNVCRVKYLPEPSEIVAVESVEAPRKSVLDVDREKKLAQVLSLSPTPMKAPDTIIRVLIWPYVDSEGRLYTAHYAFLRVDEGRWILGNYLVKPLEEGARVKFPLRPQPQKEVEGRK